MDRMSVRKIIGLKRKRRNIVVLTAYDFPFAKILDEAGVDLILVGDSLGMVTLGYETTLPVTMEDMLHHLKAVRRAVRRSFLVVDMPYRSYSNVKVAVANAKQFKQAGAQAVKLEGGKKVLKQVQAILHAGIPVMGHLGMLPQSVRELGGYKVQGKTEEEAEQIFQDAKLLERAGVFSVVLECVPNSLAKRITKGLRIPTIGIGAGPSTDGQVLVLHDMLGFESQVKPRFVRQYAHLNEAVRKAVLEYRKDVLSKHFPSSKESFKG